jgi:hypothetical protein
VWQDVCAAAFGFRVVVIVIVIDIVIDIDICCFHGYRPGLWWQCGFRGFVEV